MTGTWGRGDKVIDVSLKFLIDELNGYLQRRLDSSFGQAALGALVDDKGTWTISEDSLRMCLFQIEEERITRAPVPQQTLVDGRHVTLRPPLTINLVVLIAARFSQYHEGLRMLALVLTHFQAHSLFTPATHPGLPAGVDRLSVELVNYGPEQANQMWACLGARHLPSVVYRVRMLILQDSEPDQVAMPVTHISTRTGPR